MAPNGARSFFFPTDPDLANILGRTDLDFKMFNFFHLLDPKFLDFQVPRFLNSQIEAWADLDLLDHSSAVAPQWLRGIPRPQSW